MNDITIPDETWDAATERYRKLRGDFDPAYVVLEVLRAGLAAWPGITTKDGFEYYVPQILILPLPQEKPHE